LFGQIVSDNYFSALGADMELGRGFGPGDVNILVQCGGGAESWILAASLSIDPA
jgi:hypothetical protein